MAAKKKSTEKRYPDVLEAYVTPKHSRYISDLIIKGRRITMHNIEVAIVADRGKLSLDPCIPCLGPAIRLLAANPERDAIKWTGKEWELA